MVTPTSICDMFLFHWDDFLVKTCSILLLKRILLDVSVFVDMKGYGYMSYLCDAFIKQ